MELQYTGKDRYGYPRMKAEGPAAVEALLAIKAKLGRAGFNNLPIWQSPNAPDYVTVTLREKGRAFKMDHVYEIAVELRSIEVKGKKVVNVLAESCKLLRAPDRGEVLDLGSMD